MKKLSINILNILVSNNDRYLSRKEIESKLERVSPRAILNELKLLKSFKRIKITGQSSTTAYKISNDYYTEHENLLYIYQNQILVGYLGYDYQSYYFIYDTSYLLSGKYIAKFQMLFSFETFKQESCFVDFEELLPEGIDRKILIEKVGNATEFFLLANNSYSKNDLIFSLKPLGFSLQLEPQSYLAQKNKILGKNKFPNILEYDIAIDNVSLFPTLHMDDEDEMKNIRTMSLSGYQHKLQVVIDNNTIRTPRNGEDANYFIKPYDPVKADEKSEYYFPHIAINEHLHMSFAKNELGFDVPQSGIFKIDGDKEYHYFIKYFDRIGTYKFQRKEFSTFMGLKSDNKYNTSSEKLFKIASEIFLRESDRIRMLEYYFYSFIIRHEDMHTKNISAIYDNNKIFIAPLYDIASTGFYNGIRNFESHLSINGKQTNIRYNDFLKLVEKAKIDKNDFKEVASRILNIYIKKMPSYIKKISKLEDINFFIKERPNAQNKKTKIKSKSTLDEVMMKHFNNRCETLKENGWFKKLED
ncbi:MAG: HipA-like protein-like protein [uncultured Campylobacterales bacterium]|uniref:HipA-like protein-like protein n=1 Tax=uncultured Campylobacterales bacterium TaxID=352960 RepID=A0A6S6SQC5_9BACT|nr:MAG: HipA-like protein-like protein [uncultured Campylobacterales bacterium]